MGKTVRENVLLMIVMAVVLIGVAFMKSTESAPKVEGFRRRGYNRRKSNNNVGYGRGGWFGGSDGWRGFLPYWLLSRSVGSAISPSTVNVTESDPYLTGVSRVTATIQLVLLIAMILASIYFGYKWFTNNKMIFG